MKIDISKIDRNLVPNGNTKREDAVFYSVREDPFHLYGLYNAKTEDVFRRIPLEKTQRVGEGYTLMGSMPIGARVRFKTDSAYMILRVETPTVTPYTACGTLNAMKGFDLYKVNEEGKEMYVSSFRPPVAFEKGYEAILDLPGIMQEYILYFPMYNQVKELYIGIEEKASLQEGNSYKFEKPILFYGSSITHGNCASRTGNTYPAIIGRMLNCDTVNLGISGGAKGQIPTAEFIGESDISAFVYDYDYNAPSLAFLQETYMPFLRVIREKQPNLPIVMVSMITRDYRERQERMEFIRSQYEALRDAGDKNVYFIDGTTLISDEDWDYSTSDGTHPNDLGFVRMAEGLAPVLHHILEGKNNGV